MSSWRRLSVMVSVLGVLQGLPGVFVPGEVILLSTPLGDPMGVGGRIV